MSAAEAIIIKKMCPCFDLQETQGKEVPARETSEIPDPNVITPGTEFMEKLSQALDYYIRARLNSDPGWKDIMVCACSPVPVHHFNRFARMLYLI